MSNIKVGDIVRITSVRVKLMNMDAGYVDELEPYAGRLAKVTATHHPLATEDGYNCVAVVPLELDEALGILASRESVWAEDGEPGWWFDLDCVELVESSDESST